MADTIFDSIYPLTIVSDRYFGLYSGGNFTAWNRNPSGIPEEISEDDVTCWEFWNIGEGKDMLCGKGQTVEEAVGNLYIALGREKNGNLYRAGSGKERVYP